MQRSSINEQLLDFVRTMRVHTKKSTLQSTVLYNYAHATNSIYQNNDIGTEIVQVLQKTATAKYSRTGTRKHDTYR